MRVDIVRSRVVLVSSALHAIVEFKSDRENTPDACGAGSWEPDVVVCGRWNTVKYSNALNIGHYKKSNNLNNFMFKFDRRMHI